MMEDKRLIDVTMSELESLLRAVIKEEILRINGPAKELQDEEFVNIKEASKLIRYSTSSIYRNVCERKIPFHKVGEKRIVFKPNELIDWVGNKRLKKKAF